MPYRYKHSIRDANTYGKIAVGVVALGWVVYFVMKVSG
jgi:hypothetical protein